jgi:hypothetical protein
LCKSWLKGTNNNVANWKKIRKLSAEEIRVRVGQKLSVLGERSNLLSLGKLPTDSQLAHLLDLGNKDVVEHFRTRQVPSFFDSFANRETTTAILKSRFSGSEQAVLEKADEIINGRFDLLGFRQLSFGNPPNWHLEPISKKVTPVVHWSKLDYLDAQVAGDKKIVWELNRHQFFSTLGRAYWLTGDEKYAASFAQLIQLWMEQNPPKLGINWASSLEVGFRAISWLWALYFFRDSPCLTASLLRQILKFLYRPRAASRKLPFNLFQPEHSPDW